MDGLEIITQDERWTGVGLDEVAQQAVKATLAQLKHDTHVIELALLACDDSEIEALNNQFRDKPAATNVLSWPSRDLAAAQPGAEPEPPERDPDGGLLLGDIAIAYDTCAREAAEQDKAFTDHVTHLIVHATLHLLGYDHQDAADASLMERLEIEILGKLGLPDPY